MPAEVGGDEARLRVLAKEVVALGHQLFEGDLTRLVVAAIGEERELEPALVVEVERLEELLRLGGVDEDREIEPGEGLPDRIQLRVVHLEPAAIGLARGEAEALRDLTDADRAGLDVGFELLHSLRAPCRTDVAEVDAGQHAEPILVRAGVDRLQRARQAARLTSCRR